MFEVGFWELVLVGVVALVVVGPERHPELARTAGRWLGAARRMASTFKSDLEREMRAGELKKMLDQRPEFRGAYDVLEQTKKELQATADKLNASVDIPTISLPETDAAGTTPAAPAIPGPAAAAEPSPTLPAPPALADEQPAPAPVPAPSDTGESPTQSPTQSAADGPDGPARA